MCKLAEQLAKFGRIGRPSRRGKHNQDRAVTQRNVPWHAGSGLGWRLGLISSLSQVLVCESYKNKTIHFGLLCPLVTVLEPACYCY